jgi:DNA invertase Pin-like site-specific DNA recombinase
MKNGIIYCRVSSKEQIEGTSLESQELACGEFARSKGIEIQRVFVERGESAKFADRTELLELLDYCRKRKGELDVLLVWKLDRLARNVNDHFNIKATLLKYGLQVVSVTEPIDSNPEGKLLETILAGFAQFDNDVRAMRTVQGMRKKLQDGLFPWNAPLGYRTVARGEKKTLPDEAVQPLFDAGSFAGEVWIFNQILKPLGVITTAQMVKPSRVIHAFCHLQKCLQILCAQVQLRLGAAEIEALVGRQFALGILAQMAPAFLIRFGCSCQNWRRFADEPDERLAGTRCNLWPGGFIHIPHPSKSAQIFESRLAGRDHYVYGRQSCFGDANRDAP